MTNSRSTARNNHWLAIAGLAIAGLAMNVGCGSSGTSTPSDAGSGGSTGSGGSGAGGKVVDSGTDTQLPKNINYTFDNDVQMWAFSTYPDPTTKNLTGAYPTDGGSSDGGDGGDAAVTDAGSGADAGAAPGAPVLSWDSVIGQPTAGSLKVSVTFTDCKQYVDPGFNFTLPKNETGHMLHGRLQVTSGTFSGGAQLHVTTGADFAYASQPISIAPDGTFGIGTLDLTQYPMTGSTVNPAQVVGVGIQMFSGDVCPYPNAGDPIVFNIDTIVD